MVENTSILFQEGGPEDVQLANEYGIEASAVNRNMGIGAGFSLLASRSKSEYFLPLEQDWELTVPTQRTAIALHESLSFITYEGIDVVRLRSRKQPGWPLYSIGAYKDRELEHYCPVTEKLSPHLMDCVHWMDDAHIRFPDKIQMHRGHFTTTSRWSGWTNNPCLFKRQFYLEAVKPFLNDPLLEPSMSKWWSDQSFKIAWGEGLFTHNDPDKYSTTS